MYINNKTKMICINSIKTAIKCLKLKSISNLIEYSEEDLLDTVATLQAKFVSEKDLIIARSCLIFCTEIGGLENEGLQFSIDELKEAITEIDITLG